jgi:isopenicillin N synthase-like dioxygenase
MSAFTSFSGKTRAIVSNDTVRAASFSEIPIISLEAPLSELILQLRDACTRVGFFYIKDHGVPQEIIDTTFSCAETFFGLDRETKSECHYKKSKILRGYEPPDEVRTDESKKADMNEAFNWGYSPELDPLADSNEPVQCMWRSWKSKVVLLMICSPSLKSNDRTQCLAFYAGL